MPMLRWRVLLVVLAACGDPNDPAARAVSVHILTTPRSLLAGDTITLAAQALDAEGRAVPDVQLTWSSSDATRLTVVDAAAGEVVAIPSRGTVYARVTLPNGATDSVAIRVQPRPINLVVVSGEGQHGVMNEELRDPLTVKALAADEGGVEGVLVEFRILAGLGIVSDATRATDSLGRASVRWTVGESPQQRLEVVTLLPESFKVEFTATSLVPGSWTWVAGDSTRFMSARYGTLGVPDSTSSPGSRRSPVHAVGPDGTLWLFGGGVFTPSFSLRNDLWRWRDGLWTWVAGTDQADPPGVYGVRGVADPANVPPGGWASSGWVDGNGQFWLFGGAGADDLWRFDGTMWIWMSGDSMVGTPPRYGVRGVAAVSNSPGTRVPSAHWTDEQGRLWLYGAAATTGGRADLWMFGSEGWAWMGGDSIVDPRPQHGQFGQPHPSNTPGVRGGTMSWYTSGVLRLYGGGLSINGVPQAMGDLWQLTGTTWTWTGGVDSDDPPASWGPRGVFGINSYPGARSAAGVVYGNATLWMYGGTNRGAFRNELWQFDGTRWRWLSGSTGVATTSRAPGVWGTRGVSDPANTPSGRTKAILWLDASGTLWLYGGDDHNDLWRYDLTRLP